MKTMQILLSAIGGFALLLSAGCGGGAECGQGTVETEDGECIADSSVCQGGTIDPTTGECTAVCGSGTIEMGGVCVPDGSTVCVDGSTFDAESGTCIADAQGCGPGTVRVGNECVDRNDAITVDVQEPPEPNGFIFDPFGSVPVLTLPAVGEQLVINGCINPAGDINGDTIFEPDDDAYAIQVTGPTYLRVTADGVDGLAAGFTIIAVDGLQAADVWYRMGVSLVNDNTQRGIFLPAAGTYLLSVSDSRSLVNFESVGSAESCYYVTLENRELPTPTDFTVGDIIEGSAAQDPQFFRASSFDGDTLRDVVQDVGFASLSLVHVAGGEYRMSSTIPFVTSLNDLLPDPFNLFGSFPLADGFGAPTNCLRGIGNETSVFGDSGCTLGAFDPSVDNWIVIDPISNLSLDEESFTFRSESDPAILAAQSDGILLPLATDGTVFTATTAGLHFMFAEMDAGITYEMTTVLGAGNTASDGMTLHDRDYPRRGTPVNFGGGEWGPLHDGSADGTSNRFFRADITGRYYFAVILDVGDTLAFTAAVKTAVTLTKGQAVTNATLPGNQQQLFDGGPLTLGDWIESDFSEMDFEVGGAALVFNLAGFQDPSSINSFGPATGTTLIDDDLLLILGFFNGLNLDPANLPSLRFAVADETDAIGAPETTDTFDISFGDVETTMGMPMGGAPFSSGDVSVLDDEIDFYEVTVQTGQRVIYNLVSTAPQSFTAEALSGFGPGQVIPGNDTDVEDDASAYGIINDSVDVFRDPSESVVRRFQITENSSMAGTYNFTVSVFNPIFRILGDMTNLGTGMADENCTIDGTTIELDIFHPDQSELQIDIIHPNGTTTARISDFGGIGGPIEGFTVGGLTEFDTLDSAGTWSIRITDNNYNPFGPSNDGALYDFRVDVTCAP